MGKGPLLFVAGAGAGVVAGTVLARYRDSKRRLMTLLVAGSRVAETSCGRVEYALAGDGPAVLVSPGSGGGYDQGLYIAALFRPMRFKFVCVSRPGYLRTPLSTGRTPAQQADAYAALLDSLGVSRAAVLAHSTGGPAALQFAFRHPDRCWGLVLASAVNRATPLSPLLRRAQSVLFRSDLIPWLLNRPAEYVLLAWNGIRPDLQARLRRDPEKMGLLRGIFKRDFTASLRRPGMLNDLEQVAALPEHALELIGVPVLVIHSRTDPVVPLAQAEALAAKVSAARLLDVAEGGHLCLVTHRELIVPDVERFFEQHAPQNTILSREPSLG